MTHLDVSMRRLAYALLITVAVATCCGKILSVRDLYDPTLPRTWPTEKPTATPTLGGNDRSRWATIRALVDEGTYAIGERNYKKYLDTKYDDGGIGFEPGWRSVDKILHPETNKFYSSKPPLLPTILAGEYWLLKKVFGWSIVDDCFCVVRVILLTINAVPFLIFLLLLSRMCEHMGCTDFGRLYVMTAACFATLITPFLIVLNNHTIAAFSVLFALYPILKANSDSTLSPVALILSGLFAGFAFSNELPALAFLAGLFVWLIWCAPWGTLMCFLPAAAVPIAGLFLTNYLALGTLLPAYAKVDTDWYKFEGGYWSQKRGIDDAATKEAQIVDELLTKWGQEDMGETGRAILRKAYYAFHLLLGHHGLFSLFPIFLLSFVGMCRTLFFRKAVGRGQGAGSSEQRTESSGESSAAASTVLCSHSLARLLSGLTIFLTFVVIGFYIYKSDNYGGWTCGPRWFIWLMPLWLMTMLPALDQLSNYRWGRVITYLFLAVSVISASYPAWNPWRHPWIYDFMQSLGWLPY